MTGQALVSEPRPPTRLSSRQRAALLLEIWMAHAAVRRSLRGHVALPQVVGALGRRPARVRGRVDLTPDRLGRAVHRALRLGRRRPRCLVLALVQYRCLRRRGVDATVVIGLPQEPSDARAHAWVEVDGRDVGPPPGRNGHLALVRYR